MAAEVKSIRTRTKAETRGPDGESAEPSRRRPNTPVEAIGEDAEAALRAQQDEAERIEDAEDDAEDVMLIKDRRRRRTVSKFAHNAASVSDALCG